MTHIRVGQDKKEWLPCGHHKAIVSTDLGSRTKRCRVCKTLYRVELVPSHYLSHEFIIEIAPVESTPTVPGREAGAVHPPPSPTNEAVA